MTAAEARSLGRLSPPPNPRQGRASPVRPSEPSPRQVVSSPGLPTLRDHARSRCGTAQGCRGLSDASEPLSQPQYWDLLQGKEPQTHHVDTPAQHLGHLPKGTLSGSSHAIAVLQVLCEHLSFCPSYILGSVSLPSCSLGQMFDHND